VTEKRRIVLVKTQLTKDEEKEIIDLFLYGKLSLMDIAKRFNKKSTDFIYRVLEENNINKKRRHINNKLSVSKIQELIKDYKDNKLSFIELEHKYGITSGSIGRIIKNNNIEPIRVKKHHFNEKYFDVIDTPNKAYLLGFIWADGCIQPNHTLTIGIHNKDVEILKFFISELQSDNNIYYRKHKPIAVLTFCSKYLCNTLEQLGCNKNKTYDLDFPNIREDLIYDFIRGFMDGDGCICTHTRGNKMYINLSFTGTLSMMTSLKNIFNVDNTIRFYRNSYNIHIGKTNDVLRILNNIYDNADLYLTRKFNKYEEYLNYLKNKE
jgi:hypothetical protein